MSSDAGRLAEVTAIRSDLATDNQRRIGGFAARGIQIGIPSEVRLAFIVEHLYPTGSLARAEFELGWEQEVSRQLDNVDAQADEALRQARMEALASGIVPGQGPQVPGGRP